MRLPGPLTTTPPAGFVRPCEPALVAARPAGCTKWSMTASALLSASWASARRSGAARGADFTDRFLWIAEAVRGLFVDRAPIDGEAVVLRTTGGATSAR